MKLLALAILCVAPLSGCMTTWAALAADMANHPRLHEPRRLNHVVAVSVERLDECTTPIVIVQAEDGSNWAIERFGLWHSTSHTKAPAPTTACALIVHSDDPPVAGLIVCRVDRSGTLGPPSALTTEESRSTWLIGCHADNDAELTVTWRRPDGPARAEDATHASLPPIDQVEGPRIWPWFVFVCPVAPITIALDILTLPVQIGLVIAHVRIFPFM